MQQGTPSSTAAGAAMQRAAHLVIDGEPKVLVDEYAIRFLDDRQRARVESNDSVLQAPHVRASRAHIPCSGSVGSPGRIRLRAVPRRP